ncbi:MAG: hypothetical protein COW65_11245 [Cytophagales bacterium CG18_big_fil_WC_8_21_14_2_50_42_9]|nr:MAG: hypothetical protein COW65_11245 [Cytophagales bacterium CG18_big_fil_WC_8_21_14_2_50_42_9]
MVFDKSTRYNVPCQCGVCGYIYLSGAKLLGEDLINGISVIEPDVNSVNNTINVPLSNINFTKPTFLCPICKTENPFKPALIEFIEASLSALQKVSLEDLLNLQLKLKATHKTDYSIQDFEKAKEEIIKIAPELQSFKDLIPKTRAEAYAIIAIIISIIAIVVPNLTSGGNNNPSVEQVIVKNQTIINYNLPAGNTNVIKLATKPKVKKLGRNDLCDCGSGKKFKLCHGR